MRALRNGLLNYAIPVVIWGPDKAAALDIIVVRMVFTSS